MNTQIALMISTQALARRERWARVQLERGHHLRFTHVSYGWTKDVNNWTPDEMGDLEAYRRSDPGLVVYVAPDSPDYLLSSITPSGQPIEDYVDIGDDHE